MMNVKCFMLVLLVIVTGCVPHAIKDEINYASMEASLSDIDQKVKSYYLTKDIPDNFDAAQYKTVVDELCSSNSVCKSQIKELFDTYNVQVRKIDDTFSVMLCDVDKLKKTMEDFGCNSMLVEIKSWKENDNVPCKFEDNWQQILQQHCAE
ncbi:MAG: hypothetical protein WA096_05450 [Smithella sp.]